MVGGTVKCKQRSPQERRPQLTHLLPYLTLPGPPISCAKFTLYHPPYMKTSSGHETPTQPCSSHLVQPTNSSILPPPLPYLPIPCKHDKIIQQISLLKCQHLTACDSRSDDCLFAPFSFLADSSVTNASSHDGIINQAECLLLKGRG